MTIFGVGSHGFILEKVLPELRSSTSDIVGISSRPMAHELHLNLEHVANFPYERMQPGDIVLMAAAISSPDVCRNRSDYAWAVNVTGTSEFIAKVVERGGRVVFFSSDTVYGERDDEFDETVSCNPVGEYAVMKHEVESRFQSNPLFKAVRLSYTFAREDKFTEYLTGCAERGEEVEIFHPFYRAIIHRDDVVEGVLALARRWNEFPYPVINFGGPDILARTEIVDIVRETALPSLCYRVTEPAPEFFRNRPRVIRMKSPILEQLLGRPAHTLHEAVKIEFEKGKP